MNEEQKTSIANTELKPGETVQPRGQAVADQKTEQNQADQQKLQPESTDKFVQTPSDDQGPIYSSKEADQQASNSISWTASEYIAHHKSAGWYVVLAVAAAVLAGLVWVFTKDMISTIVVVVVAITLAFYGSKKPKQLGYKLDDSGLTVGPRHFDFGLFHSFSIIHEGAFASIVFMPLKRFAPLITVYYDPKDENTIVGILSQYLPVGDRKDDPVDRFMKRIRF